MPIKQSNTQHSDTHSNHRLALWLMAALAVGGTNSAQACGPDSYTGSVCTVSFDFCPVGTLEAKGQLLYAANYPQLYSLIGTTYGGDASGYFNLPDLRGRSIAGEGYRPGLSLNYLGEERGTETTTLTLNELPEHTHAAVFNQTGSNPITVDIPVSTAGGTASTPSPLNSYMAAARFSGVGVDMWSSTLSSPVTISGVTTSGGSYGTVTNDTAGQGQAFAHLPPQLVMKQCIVVDGLYPQRP